MLHEAGGLAAKMQVSGQRRYQHVSGCAFDLVPPAGFEPARAAPERVAVRGPDQRKHAHGCLVRAVIGRGPPVRAAGNVGAVSVERIAPVARARLSERTLILPGDIRVGSGVFPILARGAADHTGGMKTTTAGAPACRSTSRAGC